jgi:hypothetical protein
MWMDFVSRAYPRFNFSDDLLTVGGALVGIEKKGQIP